MCAFEHTQGETQNGGLRFLTDRAFSHLQLRMLYKSPVPNAPVTFSDLQWRVLYRAMATDVFVAELRSDVSPLS